MLSIAVLLLRFKTSVPITADKLSGAALIKLISPVFVEFRLRKNWSFLSLILTSFIILSAKELTPSGAPFPFPE